MDRYCSYGIVNFQDLIKEFHTVNKYNSCQDANDDSSSGTYYITSGGNGHQSSQCTVQCQGESRPLVLAPGKYHGCHCSCSCSQVGGNKNMGDGRGIFAASSCQLRSWIKSKPAKPED